MDIDKEIDTLAEKLEKSTKTEKELLLDLVKELGSEGIKKAMPELSPTQQVLLKSVIAEELSKSMKLDDKILAAPKIEAKIGETKLQEDRADDNADEKIAQAAEPEVNHQGGEKQDGWEGQVIKGGEGSKGGKVIGHTEAGNPIYASKEHPPVFRETPPMLPHEQEKAKDKHARKDVKKSETEENNMKALELVKSLNDAQKDELGQKLIAKGMPQVRVEEILGKAMSKDEAKDKIMSMEEKEHGTKDPKKLVEAEKKEHEVKKSYSWENPDRLLKACTGGRNHHFSVNGYYDEVLAKSKEEPQTEELKKSETENISDILEKGGDCSPLDVQNKQRMESEKKKMNGKVQKSFGDVDMAEALGLSVEECKKILGEV